MNIINIPANSYIPGCYSVVMIKEYINFDKNG